MTRLDDRLRDLSALGDRLIAADPDVAQRAVQAAYSLADERMAEQLVDRERWTSARKLADALSATSAASPSLGR